MIQIKYPRLAEHMFFVEEITIFLDLGIIHRAWENFISENPDSTETKQEKFLIQFVENGRLRDARNSRGIGDLVSGFNSLNPSEKDLTLKHPLQAIRYMIAPKSN